MTHIHDFDSFLNEATPNQNPEKIDTKWEKLSTEERVDLLLKYVKDSDEAEKYAIMSWSALPDPISSNLIRSSQK